MKKYAGVLVKYDNEFLLCKRNKNQHLGGFWSIPAGGIESFETPIEAAVREFKEETNISITINDLKYLDKIPRTNRDGTKVKGVMFVYLLETKIKLNPDLQNAVDGDEHSECGYCTAENIPTPTTTTLKKIIQNFGF